MFPHPWCLDLLLSLECLAALVGVGGVAAIPALAGGAQELPAVPWHYQGVTSLQLCETSRKYFSMSSVNATEELIKLDPSNFINFIVYFIHQPWVTCFEIQPRTSMDSVSLHCVKVLTDLSTIYHLC